MNVKALWLMACLMAFLPSISCGNSVIHVDDSRYYHLIQEVDFLFDSSKTWDIKRVRESQSWQPITGNSINFGFQDASLWLKFTVQANQDGDYVLHIPYPLLDFLDHYSFINNSPYETYQTGDLRDFDTRAVNHIDFVFAYPLKAQQTLSVFLRVESQGALEVPLLFSSNEVFVDHNNDSIFLRGWVSGILWLMLIYNLFIYIAIRDRLYALYVVNAFAMMVVSNSYDGIAFQVLWPSTPHLNTLVFPFFNALIQATSLMFMFELLNIMKVKTWYRQYFLGLFYCVLPLPLLAIILPYHIIVPVEVIFALIVNGSSLLLGLHLSLKGDRSAIYFTVAVLLFSVGLMSNNLKSLGLLPTNFFTQHAYQIGFFIEMVVLSLALAQRIDTAKKDRLFAQKENIKNLRRYADLYSDSLSGNFQVKKNGQLISVNSAFTQILGYPSNASLMASPVADNIELLAHDPNMPARLLKLLRVNGRVIDFEEQLKRKDGKALWVSLSMRPSKGSDEAVAHYEGSLIDTSERKENETLREQALKERMASMEQLIMGICHELNTPLGSSMTALSHIRDLVSRLSDSYHEKALTRDLFQDVIMQELESLDFTEANLAKVSELIQQFKISTILKTDYEQVESHLITLINESIQTQQERIGQLKVNVTINCKPTLCIYHYAQAIFEVIEQLVTNSLDHAFQSDQDNQITINATQDNDNIEIIYQDNGVGLSAENKQALFNPFYTTQRGIKGKTGLGMYLVFNLTSQVLKGSIEILETQTGLAFKLTLPKDLSLLTS